VRCILIRRRKQSVAVQFQQVSILPQSYVFCERASGAVRFRVEAESDGSLPVEKVASLLAMHCLVRGQVPEDYEVMVESRESLLNSLVERTQQLLNAGRALGAGVRVSRREQEVLDLILKHLANKEIASNLQVSERTVKFHVSSLLAKFGVSDRVALSREVQMGRAQSYPISQPSPQSLFGFPIAEPPVGNSYPDDSAATVISKTVPKVANRVLPMYRQERYAT
jgi:DNA-binding CsgD family transcriptional regulator